MKSVTRVLRCAAIRGYIELLDDSSHIVVPQDDYGLHAIDIFDPSCEPPYLDMDTTSYKAIVANKSVWWQVEDMSWLLTMRRLELYHKETKILLKLQDHGVLMDLLWMKVLGFCYWKKLRMLRGTIIYAEFLGGSFTYDAYHMIGPYPEGVGLIFCMEKPLSRFGVAGEDVNYINSHATSKPASDLKEYSSLLHCFGNN
uniref:beta-ketoacyl-[acyl-carrier-protein] synthase I n=1 Tax=Lactuca sativa TaxID=4236 RepID=A0A9R1VYI1_LACSA|nr:hypothetical protein LSAT_V11C300148120 [Lactuca sativa]